jgi:hypothetical protein
MSLYLLFPRLTPQNHRVTSPETIDYNCIAWSAGDVDHWWWPGSYWPIETPPGAWGIEVLQQAFTALGYVDCGNLDCSLETGFEKVALYASHFFFTHAARQLPSGKWTSKLGALADIEHDTPEDVAGSDYGDVVALMKRPLSGGIQGSRSSTVP